MAATVSEHGNIFANDKEVTSAVFRDRSGTCSLPVSLNLSTE